MVIHLSETPSEVEPSAAYGRTPVGASGRLGVLAPDCSPATAWC